MQLTTSSRLPSFWYRYRFDITEMYHKAINFIFVCYYRKVFGRMTKSEIKLCYICSIYSTDKPPTKPYQKKKLERDSLLYEFSKHMLELAKKVCFLVG